MKKRIGIILAALTFVASIGIPVSASTSYLDVRAGDIYSYYTYKDTGSGYENYYYVTPQTYVGYPVMARSSSQSGEYSSAFTQMEYGNKKYVYGSSNVPGGINYRLTAGPSYLSGPNWHLTGNYTP